MERTDPSTILIADAGPIIHLDELDALDVLSDFDLVLIPPIVSEEVSFHRPSALTRLNIRFSTTPPVTSAPSTALSILIQAFSLDRGEQEALLLMEQHSGALFITDDAAARFAAVQLGFRIHGTLGMLVRAVRMNKRSAEEVLSLLEQVPSRSTLFVQAALLAEFIEGFKQEFGL